jgi:hypothetical protein
MVLQEHILSTDTSSLERTRHLLHVVEKLTTKQRAAFMSVLTVQSRSIHAFGIFIDNCVKFNVILD